MGFAHVAQPSYRAFSFNFGEVFNGASDTLLRTCWGPFGIPQLLGLERRRRGDRPTSIRGSGLGRQRRVEDNAPYQRQARWWVLGAAFRRAIASRKAVPTNVKDQPPRPFTGKTKPLYRIRWVKTRGNNFLANVQNAPNYGSSLVVSRNMFAKTCPIMVT